ncbi:MAG: tRNA uridine-5-carboxymethylaminomethyl(34) synthesis GTPase MnmE [Ruminococcus sp.]|jgi:tRNA modification GTPase|nr:tRNA uridine-5-carboxymethylaminomethyl(34) synthesis GTPase MnmE [Ruminococcus sp.]
MNNDTVVAISTPNAVGGISVIRMSGPQAGFIADEVFVSFSEKSSRKPSEMPGYTCAYGKIIDRKNEKTEVIDDVIITMFKSPHSYTGEDVAEISCHGGLLISKKILRLLISKGARQAKAGEFTKIAFMNGKIDLSQAEAVMSLISAGSEAELTNAIRLREGILYKKINLIKNEIVNFSAKLAYWSDNPDEEIEIDLTVLEKISDTLKNLAATYDYGKVMETGIKTAIAGKPNVGKSSLMNRLLGYDRSIVTNVAGTTRDMVSEKIDIGIKIELLDTAGIHESDDKIENIGVNIAKRAIDEADLVICVLSTDDTELIDLPEQKRIIYVLNKTDKGDVDLNFPHIKISVKEDRGIDELITAIKAEFAESVPENDVIIANERQYNCILNCLGVLEEIEEGIPYDALTVELDDALGFLLELTGESVSDIVVNEVFKKFCVGK